MAVYAIGDLQGCYKELVQLLERIEFDPSKDKLLFAGDIVNRGPDSLKTLRFVKKLGAQAQMVLGNHDLHLLALWQGNQRHASKDRTLETILKAKDASDLLEWLRHQPLMYHCKKHNYHLVHAGLPPQWSAATAQKRAREVEQVLQGKGLKDFCMKMYGNEPDLWSDSLKGMERLRFITNAFTRLRFCHPKGRLALSEKGAPGSQRQPMVPWFKVPDRASRHDRILFGHWSTLGYSESNNTWGLDSGCLWGGKLTALKLNGDKPPRPIQLKCQGYKRPS